MSDEDPELDEIRKRKQLDLQKQMQDQEQQKEIQAQYEQQKHRILINILTEEARIRLNNIKMADEDFATSLEDQLIQLSRSGRIRQKITDEQLKDMLRRIKGDHQKSGKGFTIKRK